MLSIGLLFTLAIYLGGIRYVRMQFASNIIWVYLFLAHETKRPNEYIFFGYDFVRLFH